MLLFAIEEHQDNFNVQHDKNAFVNCGYSKM